MTIIALDLTKITCHFVQKISIFVINFFLVKLSYWSCIISNSWDEAFLRLPALVILLVFFFSRLFRIFDRSTLLKGFLRLGLRFFNTRVFYDKSLDINLINIRLVIMQNSEIYIANAGNRQEICFGFDIKYFFNYFSLAIELLILLFHLSLD